MRRIPIHTKLIAALTVPLVALLVMVGIELRSNTREARDIRQQANLAQVATGPGGLVSTLQDERNMSSLTLIDQQEGPVGNIVPVESVEEARDFVNRSLAEFEDKVLSNSRASEVYADALSMLVERDENGQTELDKLREQLDNDPGPRDLANRPAANELYEKYSRVVTALLNGNTRLASAIDDATLRRGADLIDLASRQTDTVAHLVNRLLNASVSLPPPPTLMDEDGNAVDRAMTAEIGGLYRQVLKNRSEIIQLGTGKYTEARQTAIEESDATGFTTLVPEIIDGEPIVINDVLDTVAIDRDESYYGFRTDVEEILVSDAEDLAADAQRRVSIFLAVALACLFLTVVVIYLVARSITRPLRALTTQAAEMANDRLPDAVQDILETPLGEDVTVPHVDPIAVKTRDEVADVAHALNTVQDSALELAVEQAVLRRNIADSFVNLGRRNQNLLGRQLDFITELEQNETDPDTLANLFRLDHLATRMRRNAESLLVLAGIEPPRKWVAPVRLTDVIRAALGEVEDYQRVTVRAVEPATIVGGAAADLAHLLAELIENALIFSPPDQTVEIRGRAQPTGYTLAVIDSGLGMPQEEITRANRRLAGAESFTIAPSKYLGHYVAGNLAARHNIDVQLHSSPGSGITATVHLPAEVLSTEAPPTSAGDFGGSFPHSGMSPEVGPAPAPALGGPGGPPRGGGPPAGPGLPQRQPSGTTESGLARRTPGAPRQGGSGPPGGAPSDDDLLRVLANYAGPGQPQTPASGTDATISPVTGTPALSELPPFPLTPPEGTPRVRPYTDQQDLQAPPQQAPPAQAPPSVPPPPAPERSPQGLQSRRPQPPGPGAGTPGRGAPAAPGTGGAPGQARQRPGMPGEMPGQPPQQRPAAPGGGAASPQRRIPTGQTPAVPPTGSGLARRVRGANMPRTNPLNLDRGGTGGNGGSTPTPGESPKPGPSPKPQPPAKAEGQGWANQAAAKNVYSFLSDFTSGVKRGLNESSGKPPPSPPEGNGESE